MLETVRDAALDALGLVLPVECAGCGEPDRGLCAACRGILTPGEPDAVLRRRTPGGIEVSAALPYEGAARRVLLGAKESGRTDALRGLGPALAAAIADRAAVLEGRDGVALCLVPSSRAAFRRRGYDPVRLLARAAGFDPGRLLSTRGGAVQKSLGAEDRAANAAGRMLARRPLGGRRLLLVDDVVTTGATLDEAARAVRAAGGEVVGAAAALTTPLRRHPGVNADAAHGGRSVSSW